eukprot:scaffold878_cov271-Pinguiococcus_pyrenoidosus.AAC.40
MYLSELFGDEPRNENMATNSVRYFVFASCLCVSCCLLQHEALHLAVCVLEWPVQEDVQQGKAERSIEEDRCDDVRRVPLGCVQVVHQHRQRKVPELQEPGRHQEQSDGQEEAAGKDVSLSSAQPTHGDHAGHRVCGTEEGTHALRLAQQPIPDVEGEVPVVAEQEDVPVAVL